MNGWVITLANLDDLIKKYENLGNSKIEETIVNTLKDTGPTGKLGMLIPNVPYGNNHTSSITGTSTILNKVNLLGKFILVLQIYPYYCIFFSLLLKVLKKEPDGSNLYH